MSIEEEIYKSLANSQRTITQDSNNALNQALIIDKDVNTKPNHPVFIAEDIFPESVPRGNFYSKIWANLIRKNDKVENWWNLEV